MRVNTPFEAVEAMNRWVVRTNKACNDETTRERLRGMRVHVNARAVLPGSSGRVKELFQGPTMQDPTHPGGRPSD